MPPSTVHGCWGQTAADAFVLNAHEPLYFPEERTKQPVIFMLALPPAYLKASASQASWQKTAGTSVMPCLAHVVSGATSMNLLGLGAGGVGVKFAGGRGMSGSAR